MTEQQISKLFLDYRDNEAELAILQVCSAEILAIDKSFYNEKRTLLEKRIAVLNHLLYMLPHDEQFVLRKHLMEGQPWSSISDMIYIDEKNLLPQDKRSLQRIKARALKRIHQFIHCKFGNRLDFLVKESE